MNILTLCYCLVAAGTLMKLVPQSEIERAKSDVSERLQKMKDLLQRVGIGGELHQPSDDTKVKLQEAKSRRKPQPSLLISKEDTRSTESFRGDSGTATSTVSLLSESPSAVSTQVADNGRREPTDTPDFSVNSVAQAAAQAPSSKPRSQPLVRKSCVDAGTDPLDSLMGSNSVERLTVPTPSRRLAHEIETQTTLPPAPVAMISLTNQASEAQEAPVSLLQRVLSTEGIQTEPEPQIDGDLIEKEMKKFLLQHLPKGDDDADVFINNNVEIGGSENGDLKYGENQADVGETVESPRMEPIKIAEQRQPPNPHSRQGYRSFRMPTSRPNSSKAG